MAEGDGKTQDRIIFDLYEIEAISISEEAFSFGTTDFDCPRNNKQHKIAAECLGYYNVNNKLPPQCNQCYKAVIFWHDKDNKVNYYTSENLKRLETLVNDLKDKDCPFHGKINSNAAVFYFNDESNTQNFLKFLDQQMKVYGIQGVLDWQKACGMYWRLKPKLWKNYKEFLGVE